MRTKLNYIVYFNTFLLSLLWICLLDSTYSKENKNESQQLLRSSPASENVDEVILEDFIHSLDSNFKRIHLLAYRTVKRKSNSYFSEIVLCTFMKYSTKELFK